MRSFYVATIATAIVLGTVVATGGGGGGPPPASLCVGASQSCWTPATCTTTISSGLVAAVNAAAAGAVVCLNTATYASSALNNITKASDVTVQAAPGQSPTMTGVIVSGSSHLKVQGVLMPGGFIIGSPACGTCDETTNSDHITFTNITVGDCSMIRVSTPGVNKAIEVNYSSFYDIGGASGSCNEGRLEVRGNQTGPSGPNGVLIDHNVFGTAADDGSGSGGCSDGIQTTETPRGTTVSWNEFRGIDQGACSAHVDPFQLYGSQSYDVIDHNWFHDNVGTDCMVSFDGSNHETYTNNVCEGQGYAQTGTDNAANVFDHNIWVVNSIATGAGAGACHFTNNVFIQGAQITNAIYVESFNLFCPTCGVGNNGTGDITNATPVFAGGASPTTYAGWALASNSPGYHAGSDGQSMGIVP